MEFKIDIDEHFARVTVWGKAVDEDGFVAFIHDLTAHADWQPGLPILVDYQRVDARALALDAVDKIASATRAARALAESRCAFVVDSTLGYGLVRQYEGRLGAESLDTAVFMDLASAQRWLLEPRGT